MLQIDLFKAHRMLSFWTTANVVAMIHNTTRTEAAQCKSPKEFFDLLTGHEGPPPVEDDSDDWDDGSSLAEAKAKRRELEKCQPPVLKLEKVM